MKHTARPRHYFKMGMTQSEVKQKAIQLHKEGVGPLAIAVRLNVSARLVMNTLYGAGLVDEYEPQCWALNDQFI